MVKLPPPFIDPLDPKSGGMYHVYSHKKGTGGRWKKINSYPEEYKPMAERMVNFLLEDDRHDVLVNKTRIKRN